MEAINEMDNDKLSWKPLPILEIIRSSISIPWQRGTTMVKALIFTVVVLALLRTLIQSEARTGFMFTTFMWIMEGIVFTIFAVTCHRFILIGEGSVPTYVFFNWSPRETRFLGWTFVIYFFWGIIMMFTVSPVLLFAPSPEWIQKTWVQLLLYILSLPGLYVLSRLSLLLPATAIDECHNLHWAWKLSESNGWRLLLVVGILPTLLSLGSAFLMASQSNLLNYIFNLIGYVFAVLEIALLSVSYKFLQAQASSIEEKALAP